VTCPSNNSPFSANTNHMIRVPTITRWIIAPAAAGVITTLVVAWLLSWLVQPTKHIFELTYVDNQVLQVNAFHSPGASRTEFFNMGRYNSFDEVRHYAGILAPGENSQSRRQETNLGSDSNLWIEHARGWPFLAMWCKALDKPGGPHWEGAIAWAPPTYPDLGLKLSALPLKPIWAGFLADAVFYALLFAAIAAALGPARRWFRRRRGKCERCGYDRRGLVSTTPCPECGAVMAT
jgi:hypothetical protein